MTFRLVLFPTLRQIARVAHDASNDPLGVRILEQSAHGLRMAIDEDRDAYLFTVGATMRHNSIQNHYMLFFRSRFFHLRTKGFYSAEVCFYDFPKAYEVDRMEVQHCFNEAALVFGWFGDIDTLEKYGPLIPIFGPDNWEPPEL